MKKSAIKVIIFDLGGVVVRGGYLDFINNYCMAWLTPLGKRKILELEREVNLGNISEQEFYDSMRNVFGVHLSPQQMHKIIVQRAKRNRQILEIISKLGKKRVAMFPNSIGHMASEILRLKNIPAKKLFRKVFVSSTMHLVKPDAEAYRYILKKMKVRPYETLMVDDRQVNIQGARRVGMNAVLYKNTFQFRKELGKYEFV